MITSTQNRRVAAAARLRKRGLREQDRRFLVEGAQAAWEAVAAGAVETVFHVPGSTGRVGHVVEAATAAGVTVIEVSPAVMGHLTSAVTPQGVVAVARFVDVGLSELPVSGLIPVLCSVRDPGNAGAILRSADASGAAGLVFTADSVDVYNPKAVRASAGSLFHLPVVRGPGPDEAAAALRARGVRILAAASDGDVEMDRADLGGPAALLLGNEAWGLPPDVRALADESVRVPIHGGAESLNLAVAAALLMFEAARQRAPGAEATDRPSDISAVVAASAHDLRHPLTALKGFASTLVDRWDRFDDESRRRMVRAMVLDVERLSGLVTLLVDASRIDQGRFQAAREVGDVADVMATVVATFAESDDHPDVEATGSAPVRTDPDVLLAILLALCDGAMWWGRDGPIRITATSAEGDAVVEVNRAGGGPSATEREEMLRGPSSGGSHMGLHLARRVAEATGGSITAEDENGITFRLRIPG
jgi:RNA methyltransferase, TrmH family